MKTKQVQELVLQSLEHEIGGVKVYETAVTCAVNAELKEELEKYLEQTRTHVTVLEEICRALKIDPQQDTPGRKVVRTVGQALVDSMKAAKTAGDPASAEIAACEAVVLA